ncbi:Putative ribonuclease H protein At1g65750 [Linum perenne]
MLPLARVPPSQIQHLQISSLIHEGTWNSSLLLVLFESDSVRSILSIPIPITSQEDKPVWFFSANGQYSTSSGYALSLRSRPTKDPTCVVAPMDPSVWRVVWSLRIQPKLRFFLWRLCHRILPTIDDLNRRGIELPSLCPVCLRQDETLEHLLFNCTVTRLFLQQRP